MKRRNRTRLTLFLLGLLTVFVLATLAGCEEECAHEWTEASCESVKTCTLCGETEGEALGHSWLDATCTAPKTCSACGKTEGDIVHTWVDATCTAPKTCTACSLTEGEALGHAWTEVTCTTPKTCSTCSLTEGEALGHTWVEATCTTAKTCSVCATVEGEIPGHTWVKATCTTAKTCAVCALAEGEALGHTWTEANCVAPKTCSTCGETEGKALGHDWKAATCETPKTCNRCGKTEGQAGHKWVNATCEAAKTCSACGKTEGNALGHSYVDATCTTAKTCSRCKKTEGSALGHKWAEATCTAPKTCTVCKQTEGSAKGHSYDKGVCTVCGNVDKNYIEKINIPSIVTKPISIPAITQKSYTADGVEFVSYSGNISSSADNKTYTYTASRDGLLRIDISNVYAGVDFKCYLLDSLGKTLVSDTYFSNGNGLTYSKVKAGETYTIKLQYQKGSSDYKFTIALTKKPVDVSAYTQINDSIEFADQYNTYTFTAPITGRYFLEVSGMKADTYVKLDITDKLGENAGYSPYVTNNGGVKADLEKGETYTIKVCFNDFKNYFSTYLLSIGVQKETVDVSDYTQVKDNIEFKEQVNVYTYTAKESGWYYLEASGMKADTYLTIGVYDTLGESVGYSPYVSNNKNGAVAELKKGESYTIKVYYNDYGNDFSNYVLTVWPQKPTTDVTSVVEISDSIQYTNQINVYSFTADKSGNHRFTLSGADGDCVVKIYIKNDLDETVKSSTYFNNNSYLELSGVQIGDHYTIVIYQNKGTSDYKLTIK